MFFQAGCICSQPLGAQAHTTHPVKQWQPCGSFTIAAQGCRVPSQRAKENVPLPPLLQFPIVVTLARPRQEQGDILPRRPEPLVVPLMVIFSLLRLEDSSFAPWEGACPLCSSPMSVVGSSPASASALRFLPPEGAGAGSGAAGLSSLFKPASSQQLHTFESVVVQLSLCSTGPHLDTHFGDLHNQ